MGGRGGRAEGEHCELQRAVSGDPTGDAEVCGLSPKYWRTSSGFEMGSERGRASLRALSGSCMVVDCMGWGQEGCRQRNQLGGSSV